MNEKIKVLHVIGALHIGGAENMAMNFLRYIDKSRFQCDYLVFGKEVGEYESEAISLEAKVIHIDAPSEGYLAYARNLKTILQEGNYDVIHSHTLLNNGLTLKIARNIGIKKRISHSHSTDSGRKETLTYKIYSYVMKQIIKVYATEYIACGVDAGNYLYGRRLFESKGIIINNGIHLESYLYSEKKRKKIRDAFGVNNQIVIGHVGRFAKVKNHMFLLDIFEQISKNNRDAILLLVGDGELRPDIEGKIQTLGLNDKVILAGNRNDVSDIMQAMDILVFPSLYEGLPIVLVEAQAAGLPCIVSANVTKELDVANLITYISLDESPNKWADEVLKVFEKNIRKSPYNEIKNAGYDIYDAIKKLENVYSEDIK